MNTGAILNRINFGMAAAAGRLPGASLRALPALDTIGSAPRDKQVDAVVTTVLNGMVSPDTRAVLLSGEHPLLAKAGSGTRDAGGGAADSSASMDEESAMILTKRPLSASRVPRPTLGNVPQLTGVPQIVGLALGSPEFQRH
jgi:hypothetical protein